MCERVKSNSAPFFVVFQEETVIEFNIPEFGSFALQHLVLDYNGTLGR
jgi:hypothetical protein